MSNTQSGQDRGKLRSNVLACLNSLSHGSTPFITTFILIHLTAPVMANLGGASLSSQTMLLGREYYQTQFGEKYLVLGPLVVHAVAGVTKRLLLGQKLSRPLSTLLSSTGYSIALFFLPLHFMTHRFHPTSSAAPIHSVGPSELDYEFVKFGLQKWPLTNWALYSGLVCCVALHFVEGTTIIWNRYFRPRGMDGQSAVRWGGNKLFKRAQVLVAIALPVLTGLYSIAVEPPMIFSFMAKRFESVYRSTWIYRLVT